MSVAAKTRPTNLTFRIRPGISRRTIQRIKKEVVEKYSDILEEDNNDSVDWFESDLHKEISGGMKPGDYLKHLCEAHNLTLREVAERVGVNAQRVHDWQSGYRGISKGFAKKLGELFNISPAVFI